MQFEECLFTRRTVRKFEDTPVSSDVMKQIINAGIYAPSACNFQAWKFIVITNQEKKKLLKNTIIDGAPACILVVYRNDLYVSGREHYDYVQSASAAIQNMLLFAHDKGLGCCWICHYPDQESVRRVFDIPSNFDTIGCIAIGHPKKGDENSKQNMEAHYGTREAFAQHKRCYSLEQVICENGFQNVEGDCTSAKYPNKADQFKKEAKSFISKLFGGGYSKDSYLQLRGKDFIGGELNACA